MSNCGEKRFKMNQSDHACCNKRNLEVSTLQSLSKLEFKSF